MSVLQFIVKINIGIFSQRDAERGKKHISALFINLRKNCHQGQRGPVKEIMCVCVHIRMCVYGERERTSF